MECKDIFTLLALILEAIGVWMIAKGFRDTTVDNIKKNTQTTYADENGSNNPSLAKSLLNQKLDGEYGGYFLLSGIFIMFISTIMEINNTIDKQYYYVCLCCAVVIFILTG